MELIILLIALVPFAFTKLEHNQSLWVDNDLVSDKQADLLDKGIKWPGGVVPYAIGPGLESIHGIIQEVAKEFSHKTCIRFVPKKSSDKHYVQLTRNDSLCGRATACNSSGVQSVWIGKECFSYGTVVHELGHAICMSHEHQRPDRDEYITLKCEQYPKKDDAYSTLGLMYDFTSVMHISDCNGTCLEPKLPGVQKCGGLKLSVLDAEKVNSLYECEGCHGYRFRRGNEDASEIFVAGSDFNGAELAVCRAYVEGDIVLGKTGTSGHGNTCNIAYKGTELFIWEFEVLTHVNTTLFGWHSMRKGEVVPYHSIPGGWNKDGEPQFIGRCSGNHDGRKTVAPGKIDHGRMYYAYAFMEHECEEFEILRYLR